MQLYTAIPASKVSVPKNQFMLRHKLALRGALLKPSWDDWEAARAALDRVTVSRLLYEDADRQPEEALERAEEWLVDGEEKLGDVESRTLRTTSLRQAAHANATLVAQGVPLAWDEETRYSIPRLKTADPQS